MRLQVLRVPGCPHAATLTACVADLVAGRAQVEEQIVHDRHEAAALRMSGSPTLLIDGVDPFAVAGQEPSLSCRLYADENGSLAGTPSPTQLRAALGGVFSMPEQQILSAYDPAWAAAGTAAVQAALPGDLRRLHRAILAFFLDRGGPPDQSWLQERARQFTLDPHAAVARLAAADLVHLDQAGRVSVAYPFSGTPRGHTVRLAGGPPVWAMCAIDALGIPQMSGRDGTVTAADPHSGEPVHVQVASEDWRWSPQATTVLVARASADDPSAVCGCPHVNFFTRPDHARAYLTSHPELAGQILGQRTAVDLARVVFGPLLHPLGGDGQPAPAQGR
jgi:Alkylmercury lyase